MTGELPVVYGPVVAKLTSDGRFHDELDVVTEGLRLVMLREQLHADVQAGIDELDSGKRIKASEVYTEARRQIKVIEERNTK
jgi:hypothetical protein